MRHRARMAMAPAVFGETEGVGAATLIANRCDAAVGGV